MKKYTLNGTLTPEKLLIIYSVFFGISIKKAKIKLFSDTLYDKIITEELKRELKK